MTGFAAPDDPPHADEEQYVSRTTELVATIGAGTLGAVLAVVAVGAELLLVLPAAIGIAVVAMISRGTSRT